MAEGRSRANWGHTSNVLALIANANRDPKKKPEPFTADDFNPHTKKPTKEIPKVKMADVKDMLSGLIGRRG